jgi:hypothetical protein
MAWAQRTGVLHEFNRRRLEAAKARRAVHGLRAGEGVAAARHGAAPVAIRPAGSRLYPPLRTQPEALRNNGQHKQWAT